MMDACDFVKNYIMMCSAVGDCEQCPCGETNFCTAPSNLRSLDGADEVVDYFRGLLDFKGLIDKFHDINRPLRRRLKMANTTDELESIVRTYKIFNMND